MCGISGALNISDRIDVRKLKNMTDIIGHRGPDDEGFYLYGKTKEEFAFGKDSVEEVKSSDIVSIDKLYNNDYFLGFGHRRLNIIDLSAKGHQPMSYSDIIITYNGEIYNYLELKKELENLGYNFETDGDTEVIIKAYKHWGEDCVNHFNGMWAFAIWDKNKKKLFCSRDRFGIKPFYYYIKNGNFIFGSEIKQIIEYGIKPRVNEKILFAFLFYGIHDFCEETFFEEIYTLKGGENISIKVSADTKNLSFKKYKYWDLDYKLKRDVKSFEEESDNLGKTLENSIKLRLRSDVEIGSCLSGGLDSSSIVTLACGQLSEKNYDTKEFKTFTSCYDDAKEVDERYYSDLVVRNSDCSSIKVKPTTDKIKSDLEALVWHQDEPFGSLSIFAGWCVMETAKENGVKVLLDGQGGDETLLGYERFYAYALKEKIKNLKILDAIKEYKLSSENSKLNYQMLLGYLIYFNNSNIRKQRLKSKNAKFLNSTFVSNFINEDIVNDLLEFKTLQEVQNNELFSFISHLLRYEDRNSMAHSIEARVPFLDYVFVQKAASLPTNYKLRNGWTKAPLRKYMESKMPKEVTYRKNKLGFSVPQEKWINEINDYFKEKILDNPKSTKYFNIEYIKEIFNNKTNPEMRFKFIIVELWMRTFIAE